MLEDPQKLFKKISFVVFQGSDLMNRIGNVDIKKYFSKSIKSTLTRSAFQNVNIEYQVILVNKYSKIPDILDIVLSFFPDELFFIKLSRNFNNYYTQKLLKAISINILKKANYFKPFIFTQQDMDIAMSQGLGILMRNYIKKLGIKKPFRVISSINNKKVDYLIQKIHSYNYNKISNSDHNNQQFVLLFDPINPLLYNKRKMKKSLESLEHNKFQRIIIPSKKKLLPIIVDRIVIHSLSRYMYV